MAVTVVCWICVRYSSSGLTLFCETTAWSCQSGDAHNRWTFLRRCERLNFPFVTLSNSTIKITVEKHTKKCQIPADGPMVWECIWCSVVVFVLGLRFCSGPALFRSLSDLLHEQAVRQRATLMQSTKLVHLCSCGEMENTPSGRLKPIQTEIHSLWLWSRWMLRPPEGKSALSFVIRPHERAGLSSSVCFSRPDRLFSDIYYSRLHQSDFAESPVCQVTHI